MATAPAAIDEIKQAFARGRVIPYLGPGVLADAGVPASPEALAEKITARVSVPFKIRKRLTAAAQFIENFKHRRTLVDLMRKMFEAGATPTKLHRALAALPSLPMIVDAWYDDAMQSALSGRAGWGQVQGLSQSEHFGTWVGWYDHAGSRTDETAAATWQTLLYKPYGGVLPASNFLVSDSDFVEVLTEIDIQTPIPERVQELRRGRSFLFLGCRFDEQLQRTFARQVSKRSSERHWAVLPHELTHNERRFLGELGIEPLSIGLDALAEILQVESRAAA